MSLWISNGKSITFPAEYDVHFMHTAVMGQNESYALLRLNCGFKCTFLTFISALMAKFCIVVNLITSTTSQIETTHTEFYETCSHKLSLLEPQLMQSLTTKNIFGHKEPSHTGLYVAVSQVNVALRQH